MDTYRRSRWRSWVQAVLQLWRHLGARRAQQALVRDLGDVRGRLATADQRIATLEREINELRAQWLGLAARVQALERHW